jgi:hypothetical protein
MCRAQSKTFFCTRWRAIRTAVFFCLLLMCLETTQTTAATAAAMITSRLFWACSATEAWLSPLSLPEPLEQALPVSEAVWSMEGSVSVRRAAKQKNAKKAGGFLVFAQKRYLCGKVFWGILRKKRIAKNSLKTAMTVAPTFAIDRAWSN